MENRSGLTQLVKSNKGLNLENWVNNRKNQERIKGMRLLYVIRANLDDKRNTDLGDIFKIGIAGNENGKPIGRLLDYVYILGDNEKKNPCSGAKLFWLGGTKYVPGVVNPKDSKVFKKENFLIRQIREWGKNAIRKGKNKKGTTLLRGRERTTLALNELIKLIYAPSGLTEEDKVQKTRRSERIADRDLQGDDKVVAIETHITSRQSKNNFATYYRVRWNRPYKDGSFVSAEERAKKVSTYPGGKAALERYQEARPSIKFYD